MINRIIVGTMTWGKWGKNLSIKEMSDKIEFCFDHALNTFDHADIYGGYTTESDFGKAFKFSGINRKDLFFISKCGIQYPCDSKKAMKTESSATKTAIPGRPKLPIKITTKRPAVFG